MNDFIAGLLAGNREYWFWLVIGPLAVYGLLFGKRDGGGDDGGGSGSFGGDCGDGGD